MAVGRRNGLESESTPARMAGLYIAEPSWLDENRLALGRQRGFFCHFVAKSIFGDRIRKLIAGLEKARRDVTFEGSGVCRSSLLERETMAELGSRRCVERVSAHLQRAADSRQLAMGCGEIEHSGRGGQNRPKPWRRVEAAAAFKKGAAESPLARNGRPTSTHW